VGAGPLSRARKRASAADQVALRRTGAAVLSPTPGSGVVGAVADDLDRRLTSAQVDSRLARRAAAGRAMLRAVP
jgi:hypothetical protein